MANWVVVGRAMVVEVVVQLLENTSTVYLRGDQKRRYGFGVEGAPRGFGRSSKETREPTGLRVSRMVDQSRPWVHNSEGTNPQITTRDLFKFRTVVYNFL